MQKQVTLRLILDIMRTPILLCVGIDEFVVSLQKFMETSTLGEYNTRLRIVAAFLADITQEGEVANSRH